MLGLRKYFKLLLTEKERKEKNFLIKAPYKHALK